MTALRHISELADAVMPDVAADFAALYPAATALSSTTSTRAAAEHGSPPRAVWIPWRDDYQGPQKRSTGGASLQHSLGTRVAGVRVHLWAGDIAATEDLVECLVRHLLRRGGSGSVGVSVLDGAWVDEAGASQLGEGYVLTISYPVDIRAQAATPPANATVTPQLNTAGAGTQGDGVIDSQDL